jgi:hypothetical protein
MFMSTSTETHWASPRPTIMLAAWTFAWTASVALAKFGPGGMWDVGNESASWAAVALTVAVGIGWIWSFARYLRSLDELWRKINLDALAATLGLGWVAGFAYLVADAAGLVAQAPSIAILPVGLAVVYMASIAAGYVRYR